jgi:hypothetical protein
VFYGVQKGQKNRTKISFFGIKFAHEFVHVLLDNGRDLVCHQHGGLLLVHRLPVVFVHNVGCGPATESLYLSVRQSENGVAVRNEKVTQIVEPERLYSGALHQTHKTAR